jgi:hypothetical protein
LTALNPQAFVVADATKQYLAQIVNKTYSNLKLKNNENITSTGFCAAFYVWLH